MWCTCLCLYISYFIFRVWSKHGTLYTTSSDFLFLHPSVFSLNRRRQSSNGITLKSIIFIACKQSVIVIWIKRIYFLQFIYISSDSYVYKSAIVLVIFSPKGPHSSLLRREVVCITSVRVCVPGPRPRVTMVICISKQLFDRMMSSPYLIEFSNNQRFAETILIFVVLKWKYTISQNVEKEWLQQSTFSSCVCKDKKKLFCNNEKKERG